MALGKRVAVESLGETCWSDMEKPSMGAEDFSYYLRECPGAMFRLGMGEQSALLHTSRFDFNDKALKNGVLFLVATALKVLEG